jgi:hypothetical protein
MPTGRQAMPRTAVFVVQPEVLSSTLRQFATSVTFFKYGEKLSAPVDSSVLVAHKAMVRSLTALSPNLSFTKKTMTAAFQQLGEEAKFPALNTNALLDDWVTTMTARVRLACRHVAKARAHRPPPAWLQHIDGSSDSVPMTEQQGVASMASPADPPVVAAAAHDEAKLEINLVRHCLYQALLHLFWSQGGAGINQPCTSMNKGCPTRFASCDL